jgi:hypothetical protein
MYEELLMDDQQVGGLVEAVKNLSSNVEKMSARIEKLETTMHTGRGVLIALAATLGLFLTDLVDWFRALIGGGR